MILVTEVLTPGWPIYTSHRERHLQAHSLLPSFLQIVSSVSCVTGGPLCLWAVFYANGWHDGRVCMVPKHGRMHTFAQQKVSYLSH